MHRRYAVQIKHYNSCPEKVCDKILEDTHVLIATMISVINGKNTYPGSIGKKLIKAFYFTYKGFVSLWI